MARIAAYRNEPDGFAAHIANADAQRKIADGVGRSPATSAEAKAALKTLEDAERVIQREYNWLKTNKTARDEAKQIEAEIARDIVPVMERFKAGDYARVAYGKGDRLRKDGNAALSKGDFPAAKAKLSEAKKQLSAAAAEAKGFCIDTHLKTAKKWMSASKWQKCVEECDTVLGWDSANAEAKKLKAEAENHIVPTEKVVVKQNGTELNHGDVKTLTLPGGATMEMIYVGPGTFTMGSPSSEEGRYGDETQHRVTLTKGFWLGKYEVTQKQWQSVMGANPSYFKGDNLPVENVSWNDCQEFARKVNDAARRQFGGGSRLPTEAEWEYACRAGTSDAYSGTGRLDDMGWYSDNSGSKTHTVGQKRANGWGFHDMHGNVFEWCQDWYGDYGGNSTDPSGPASGDSRVLRGGGWRGYARLCRSASRRGFNPGYRSNRYGFRLCCSGGASLPDQIADGATNFSFDSNDFTEDSFFGVKFGEVIDNFSFVSDADEPTLIRSEFRPKKACDGFDDYYVYVTPITHKAVKIYACAKKAIAPNANWRQHYLIKALEKRYNTWARPRSYNRPIYSFAIGSERFVTACLYGASRDYETVLVAWDDTLLKMAAEETAKVNRQKSEKEGNVVSDTTLLVNGINLALDSVGVNMIEFLP